MTARAERVVWTVPGTASDPLDTARDAGVLLGHSSERFWSLEMGKDVEFPT